MHCSDEIWMRRIDDLQPTYLFFKDAHPRFGAVFLLVVLRERRGAKARHLALTRAGHLALIRPVVGAS
jgi:hypothetical protein